MGITDARQKTREKSLLPLLLVTISYFVSPWLGNVTAHPWLDDCNCHDDSGYAIGSNVTSTMKVKPGETFMVTVNASGTGGIICYHPESKDNDQFLIDPTDTVPDGSTFDLNPLAGKITVTFTFTAPHSRGAREILLYVRSPGGSMPNIACITISVQVGNRDVTNVFGWIVDSLLNHMYAYLGSLALLFLAIATILQCKNKHHVKLHGILATIAFGLSITNVINAIPISWRLALSWLEAPRLTPTSILHVIHACLGITGTVAGMIAFLDGLRGRKTRIPGFIALACWTGSFLIGVVGWGFTF
ncbi:hypothetical protein GF325_05215 [Candidatus Bathyarchaeota archaeon]|nr:hypothetical protein [Candidatus Bathyarchaeota archaeon]